MSEEPENKNGRWVLMIFIVIGIVTIAGTFISNFVMWRNYDTIETEKHIAPEDAIPLPKPLPGEAQ
ncbi:hypothetical protein [Devosia naphthalenivorans]|uniref:hypothetical protein n=1 Tax=Devosia naphthalenivorans TaxID=2082392 RepID=UPI000D34EA77|nr:hypothetical protein [Devosia naphthalenivorans]